MPMPTPRDGERQDEFIERCMGDSTMVDDFPEADQRRAVCQRQWDSKGAVMATKEIAVGRPKSFKADGDEGAFTAVFATLNVIDHDGDRILNGAIGNQNVVISAYGHGSWMGELPVGKGRIYEQGDEAIVEGKFFLDTEAGGETYKTVKNVAELQEWSFALPEIDYQIVEEDGTHIREIKRIKVNEVSPVLMGAGVNTRLLSIKSRNDEAIDEKPKEADVGEREDEERHMSFAKQVEEVVEAAERVTSEAKHIRKSRDRDGKDLGRRTKRRLKYLREAMIECIEDVDGLLKNPNDELKQLVQSFTGGTKNGTETTG